MQTSVTNDMSVRLAIFSSLHSPSATRQRRNRVFSRQWLYDDDDDDNDMNIKQLLTGRDITQG